MILSSRVNQIISSQKILESIDKEQEKKKITEVKTFSVPFALKKVNENINIRFNTPSNPSKEKLINQAFNFHLQGNIPKAAQLYRYLINQGLSDHRVFSNYGVILKDHGKLQEAEISLQKAIEIKPDFAEAHLNLGAVLEGIEKLKEGEISLRKAIEIKPDFAEAYYNLGNILKDLGKQKESFDSYLKVIEINPNFPNIYISITRFLKDSDPHHLNKSKLTNILNLLLEKKDIQHDGLFKIFNFLYRNRLMNNQKKLDLDFVKAGLISNEKLIIIALKKIRFKDIRLEIMLTEIRKDICYNLANNIEVFSDYSQNLIIALAEQCFLNEYIYSVTDKENMSINQIINSCKNGELNEENISIISCYFPLYKLLDQIPSLKSFISFNHSFQELINLQITEPLKEIELSKNIQKLGSINDDVSQKVKSQYEENPYPRWRNGNPFNEQNLSISQAINTDISPNSISQNIYKDQVKVMIAGCGTGEQILKSQRYKNAKVTAIDLSLSSLSYAQRKINELGIDNVELIQMDILEVDLLEDKFDIIEAHGVLHHMNDPLKGLKKLLGVLDKNGLLSLGLYSELARQDVIKSRNFIKYQKLETNEKSIRDFRQKVISNKLKDLKSLEIFSDFYSLSEFRDLCFHTQEHRFTIKQLQETLESNQLNFLGFGLQKPIKSLYKHYFPEDNTQTNLQNWARFEEKHPNTFREMYQFWVSKAKK